MIFQDPSSLDPLVTIDKIISEPLEVTPAGKAPALPGRGGRPAACRRSVPRMLSRRAGELSGDQRQRVAIARSLTTHPVLLVADEAVASLDMSARGQVLNLLADIQERSGLTCVHISRGISMVRHICVRVAVMSAGRIVELAGAESLFAHPRHPYTAGPISAIPSPDPAFERTHPRIAVVGEYPDLTKQWSGCPLPLALSARSGAPRRGRPPARRALAGALLRLPLPRGERRPRRGARRGGRGTDGVGVRPPMAPRVRWRS
jgi:oligopeptide/dipeptide ABC transporter ATP-binding protein